MLERFLFGSFHIYDTRRDNDILQRSEHFAERINDSLFFELKEPIFFKPLRIQRKPGFEFVRLCQTLWIKINDFTNCWWYQENKGGIPIYFRWIRDLVRMGFNLLIPVSGSPEFFQIFETWKSFEVKCKRS